MEKPIVFISHISEEREIARALKKLVESTFIGMMNVFVSSDPDSVQLGQKWLERISFALDQCAVEIVLASPISVRRPWINFEAGAGWIRDIPVIPLCHSGMTPERLPAPLNTLQAATITNEDQLRLIFPVLAHALRSGIPAPDFREFVSVVKNFEDTTSKNLAVSEQLLIPDSEGLLHHEQTTLVEAAELSESPNSLISTYELKKAVESTGYRKVATMLAIKMLERRRLLELVEDEDHNGYPNWHVRITDEGWLWLEVNKNLLALKLLPPTDGISDNDVPF